MRIADNRRSDDRDSDALSKATETGKVRGCCFVFPNCARRSDCCCLGSGGVVVGAEPASFEAVRKCC
jgi:hypothetical protein